MIRPREGDFCYSKDELRQMQDDISYFSDLGVFGVVFGVLNENNSIDEQNSNNSLDSIKNNDLIAIHYKVSLFEIFGI